jgi:hypothetical protein
VDCSLAGSRSGPREPRQNAEDKLRSNVRQALLKPAFAHLYPGIPANEWQPAEVLTDLVMALRPRVVSASLARDRVLDGPHFEFRGVPSAGSHEAQRALRLEERKRRLAD